MPKVKIAAVLVFGLVWTHCPPVSGGNAGSVLAYPFPTFDHRTYIGRDGWMSEKGTSDSTFRAEGENLASEPPRQMEKALLFSLVVLPISILRVWSRDRVM